ncbi:hypothetical protein BDM02DRAFT_1281482 [Thelephora ganbajun]|uniref:Uncharacterized protein n=1 Tax=Thelephora ganbajun TaxID=370292 RepID=A0ACB6Z2T2_THEGA|nr:hypothetical protein BDM02DRAFT_1281482 [Thelephora ganbajun]
MAVASCVKIALAMYTCGSWRALPITTLTQTTMSNPYQVHLPPEILDYIVDFLRERWCRTTTQCPATTPQFLILPQISPREGFRSSVVVGLEPHPVPLPEDLALIGPDSYKWDSQRLPTLRFHPCLLVPSSLISL